MTVVFHFHRDADVGERPSLTRGNLLVRLIRHHSDCSVISEQPYDHVVSLARCDRLGCVKVLAYMNQGRSRPGSDGIRLHLVCRFTESHSAELEQTALELLPQTKIEGDGRSIGMLCKGYILPGPVSHCEAVLLITLPRAHHIRENMSCKRLEQFLGHPVDHWAKS
eukprot:CAMPEP_0118979636 /NCGR_PEP_ID=MMETSP1173-20130426/26416_1 /TAXON_ID=1034831 /ORGANISM="Rhizochromulina marina cf, Strain CCMP1243" /LENGTH=165 /DNA_ID=CAMNT_0006929907 /DNA_START=223 /DNA_END=720 /DNA_ORIENTATION=+